VLMQLIKSIQNADKQKILNNFILSENNFGNKSKKILANNIVFMVLIANFGQNILKWIFYFTLGIGQFLVF
jgi:hypothetical protein